MLRWHDNQITTFAYLRYLAPLVVVDASAPGDPPLSGDELPQSVLSFLADYFSGCLARLFPARGINGGWLAFRDGPAQFWRGREPADVGLVRQVRLCLCLSAGEMRHSFERGSSPFCGPGTYPMLPISSSLIGTVRSFRSRSPLDPSPSPHWQRTPSLPSPPPTRASTSSPTTS